MTYLETPLASNVPTTSVLLGPCNELNVWRQVLQLLSKCAWMATEEARLPIGKPSELKKRVEASLDPFLH